MKNSIFIFLIVICSLLSSICYAQWQPDVRLTNNSAASWISWNNAWCIAASGNFVHVVWYDFRDGNDELYYKRSTDSGVSWGADIRLTNNFTSSLNPSVSVSGQVVHVVWYDFHDGNDELYYKRSTDMGISWGADTRLTNNSAESYDPSVSVSGQVVHVVWYDNRDGNVEIYYKRSTDSGVSWEADTRLTNNSASSLSPSVSVSTSVVHVVWFDERDGNDEIYYKRSTDGGVSWGADTRLTNNSAESYDPSVSVSGQVVHVVWHDNRDGNVEIYYKRSTDGGISWEADTRLTNNSATTSQYPSVTVSGQVVHVVWSDFRDENWEIYYKRSTDSGVSWGADTRLTNQTSTSWFPSVAVSGQVVHVIWQDYRDENYEIYYKRDPTGNPPIGIININSEIPNEFSLSQNYPNPFNPTTRFKIQIAKSSDTKVTIYDVLGREVETLVNQQLKPGTYEVDWSADKIASGVYYYKLVVHQVGSSTGDFVETKKMVLIR